MSDTGAPQRINFYAAFGVGLATSLVIMVIFTAGMLLSSQLFPYDTQQWVLFMLIFLSLVLFFGLATLLGSKYGWRTVVMSFVVQGVVLLLALFVLSATLQRPNHLDYRNDVQVGPSLAE